MTAAAPNGPVASPLARRLAQGAGLDLAALQGSGPHGRIVEADVERALATPPAARARVAGPQRLFASPLARRLAEDAGIDLSAILGSGPNGRVVERDVVAARAKGPTPAAEPAPLRAPGPDTSLALYELDSYESVPHDAMRKAIARRLTEAAQTIPHFYLTCDCEIDTLLRLREDYNLAAPKATNGEADWKISVNDFVVKAMALALRDVPDARVTFSPDAMLRHKHSDVGVAVAIPGGLVTPIVRRAEEKSVRDISAEIRALSARAKERRLKPMEYEGGVASVSNLGMYGVRNFTALINPPQSTILAVGAGEQRIVARNGAPTIATMMTVTLSCDHRAVDGALGAQLLAAFKRTIEHPAMLLA
jgi:pyruvate dehydrogenase E2 component (dihydrolipoamide acetyltransferase)